jgi:hypothetical protein
LYISGPPEAPLILDIGIFYPQQSALTFASARSSLIPLEGHANKAPPGQLSLQLRQMAAAISFVPTAVGSLRPGL